MPNTPAARVRRWQATVILTLFFFAVAGAAAIGWWYARESPPHQGPIVLISVDRMGTPRPPAADAGRVQTPPPPAERWQASPAIDALAAESVIFERAYTHSPQTLPAHASLLSGQLPPDHGVRDDAGFTLREDVRTLAEQLRSRGFNTGAAVSSFLLRPESGVAQGFAFFDAEMPDGGDESTFAEGAPALEREARLTVDAAERWLETQNGQRFFLFVQLDQPEADAAIMRLAQLLKERRLYDKATIVLVGDRGAAASDLSLDEASLHVPLLVKQPDSLGAGRRVTAPVQHIDVVPTILDLVRAPVPNSLRGRSLRSVLDDEDAKISDQPIYAEALAAFFRVGGAPLVAASNSHFRLVRGGGDDTLTALLPLDAAAPETAQRQSLGAWLDRLTTNRAIAAPSPVAARDEDRYALFGFLSGLPPAAAGPAPVEGDATLAKASAFAKAPADKPAGKPADARVAIYAAQAAAARLAGRHDYHAAITTLQDLLREHPDVAAAHFQVGRLLAWAGRPERAIDAFTAATELRPDALEPLIELADVLIRQGHHEAAELQVQRAIALADRATPAARASAYLLATRAALARGEFEVAAKHAEAVQAADPHLPMVSFVRGRQQHEAGEYEAAVESLTAAETMLREHGTTVPDLHLILGESLAHRDRYVEAEMQFRQELRAHPRSLQAYASLAMLYRAANRTDDLAEVLEELVAAAPTPDGYAMAARLWTIAGDRSRADALRAEARTRFRADPAVALLGRGARR